MPHPVQTGSELRVKVVLESLQAGAISVDVVSDRAASFDCSTVQEAVRGLMKKHSEWRGVSDIVLWNRLAPDSIDDVVACLRELGCQVLSEHEDHVRFRLAESA
jgi:hypothetical protein